MNEAVTRLNAALEGRYRIEREIGEGGMATCRARLRVSVLSWLRQWRRHAAAYAHCLWSPICPLQKDGRWPWLVATGIRARRSW